MSTLNYALANGDYVSFVLGVLPATSGGVNVDLRGAIFTFGINRVDYHAPRDYAVFTNISGFATNTSQIFDTGFFDDTTADDYSFALPTSDSYSLTAAQPSAIEFRIYGYQGQYAGHCTSLFAFNIALVNYVDNIVLPAPVAAEVYYNDWCPSSAGRASSIVLLSILALVVVVMF